MNLDTRTVVLVTRRLVALRDNPPLFHERITPATIRTRLERVRGWLGEGRCCIVAEYLRRGELPPRGRRDWARAWKLWEKPAAQQRDSARGNAHGGTA